MATKRPRCPYCGRPKRQGTDAPFVCSECRRVTREAQCELRAWDKSFDDRVARLLIFRAGQWVRLTAELRCTSDDAAAAVDLLRRHGFVIEGDSHDGRRLIGWTRWPT